MDVTLGEEGLLHHGLNLAPALPRRERLEVFLLGWVKVLAIFFVLWWVVENILTRPLFRFRVFSTRVVSDVEKKLHQF